MKFLNKIKIYIISIVFLGTMACESGFNELNIDPNQSTDVELAFQFAGALVDASDDRFEAWRTNFIYPSGIVQHCANTWWTGNTYGLNDQWFGAYFDRVYTGYGKNIVDLINRAAEDPEEVNILSAARIWRAYLFQKATDLYGDVPYSEAGLGFINGVNAPAYDNQQAIYTDMINELTEAVADFDATKKSLQGDLIFNGDLDKWTKFANSLRLRMGMRMSKVDAATAQSVVSAAINAGVMTSNDDIAYMEHTDQRGNGNSAVVQADHFFLYSTLVDYMKSTNDPRLPIFGQVYDGGGGNVVPTDPANYIGLPVGAQNGGDEFVRINLEHFRSNDVPYFHMLYAEVEFLLAEAAVRGWGASDAASHYNAGVRAHMEHLAMYPGSPIVSEAEISTFLTNNTLDESTTEASLQDINEQLWVAHFFNGYEAFANWRRSGYPALTPSPHPSATVSFVPRILPYPGVEAINNPDNFNAAVAEKVVLMT